jgi:predicted acetylornithine/succinylornithine family transaminase
VNSPDVIRLFERHVIPNYTRIPAVFVRGAGSRLWDAEGREYLDLFPGWGVSGLGHCHPKVVEAVRRQAGELFHIANNYYTVPQGAFAEVLATRGDGQQCFFANSGAEANEGAIKLARLARQPKYRIVTFADSFHGRTFAAISATGQPAYRKGFEPTVPGFSHATLNDLDSVKALVDGETCAVMVEPVQGEGGVRPCTERFLKALRAFCDERGLLLIFDEVQTAPARLGTWFGYQRFGVEPDILTSAKALAGGMPLGVIMAKPEVAAALVPGTHASTFGGNAIGCAAGLATFRAIEEEGLLEAVGALGAHLDKRLPGIDPGGAVTEIRREGLMVGVELAFPGAPVVDACREAGCLINCTHGNVLRLLPALTITREELDRGLGILAEALRAAQATAEAGA